MFKSIVFILVSLSVAGCTTNRYIVSEGSYSAWKGERMQIRKKTILLDTKTGETWALAYDKENKQYTNDGYGWEKLPVKERLPGSK